MAAETKQARRRRYNRAGASRVWVKRDPLSRKSVVKDLMQRIAKRKVGGKNE